MVDPVAEPSLAFDVAPDSHRHWDLATDGPVATLVMRVDPAAGIRDDYELKTNSYDLGVDIELHDLMQRLRFEHPAVKVVLAGASHNHKVNFCKFTNETRNALEEASANSGQTWTAAVNGTAAGGGYELALACDEILLVDDRSSAVSLLSRTCDFMLKEEAHHMFVGATGVGRVVQRTLDLMRKHDTEDVHPFGGINLDVLQKYINFHYSVSLDLFGSETSTNAANYFGAGIKGRFQEERRQDDHQLKDIYRLVPHFDSDSNGDTTREVTPVAANRRRASVCQVADGWRHRARQDGGLGRCTWARHSSKTHRLRLRAALVGCADRGRFPRDVLRR